MKKILTFLLILQLSIFFLIFNDKGNEFLKPYLSTYLESQLDNNMTLNIEHLKVDYDHIEFTALVNNLTTLKGYGELSLLEKKIDLNYTLKADSFKSDQITIKSKVDVNGTVEGYFDNMNIIGMGDAFNSKIDYFLNLKDELLSNIKIKILKADLAEILQLSGQANYAKGKIDVDIDIPSLESNQTEGSADILLHQIVLNQKVLNKEFKVDIPKKTILTGNLHSNMQNNQFKIDGKIKSNLAVLTLNDANYNPKEKSFSSLYKLEIPKLSKLVFLTKQKLFGALKVNGSIQMKENQLQLQAKTKSLGGNTDLKLKENQLNLKMNTVDLSKLLHLMGEKPYVKGKVLAHLQLDNLKTLNGKFDFQTKEAKTINHTLKKEININFGKAIPFTLEGKGDIKSNIAYIQTNLNSELLRLKSSDMQYNLKKSEVRASYLLNIPQLSKLNAVAGKKLQGKITVHGKIKSDKSLLITGNSKDLGGDIAFKLKKQQLHSTFKKVSAQKLVYMLNYPQIFKASLVGDFNYDLKQKRGLFNSSLEQAQLLPNQLTELIKQILGVDLVKERYNQTTFVAQLNQEKIHFDFNAKSKKVIISIPNGYINKDNNSIDSKYKVKIENKDIAGRIKGSISHPHITIDSSQFIQGTITDLIKDQIGKDKIDDKLKDLGIDKNKKDSIKNILGDIFK